MHQSNEVAPSPAAAGGDDGAELVRGDVIIHCTSTPARTTPSSPTDTFPAEDLALRPLNH